MRILVRWSSTSMWKRYFHKHYVTENIEYFTRDKVKVLVDPKTLCINKLTNKPICIQMNYMSAGDMQIERYANLILDEGLDVISIRCEIRHFLQPEKEVQKTAYNLLQLMLANDTTYVLYGLCIGSYVWSETLVHVMKNQKLYQPVLDRIAAQIWDSIPDIRNTPSGAAYAIFPNGNKLVHRIVGYFYEFYMKSCYSTVTKHYDKAQDCFLHTPYRGSALFLLSRDDTIAPADYIQHIYETWVQNGIKSTWKCWDKSFHVSHYMYYPQEYRTLVRTHLHQNVPGLSK